MLATLAITRQLKESGPAAPDARMALSGTLHLVAVGAATGAAALVGKIHDWIAWPLGGAAAILVYLLFAGAEYQIAPRLPVARGQRLERAVECRSDGTEFEEESCVEGSGAACGRSNPRSSAGPTLQWRGFGAPTPTPPGRAAGSRRRPTRVLACRAAATWTLQTWAYKVLFEMPTTARGDCGAASTIDCALCLNGLVGASVPRRSGSSTRCGPATASRGR